MLQFAFAEQKQIWGCAMVAGIPGDGICGSYTLQPSVNLK